METHPSKMHMYGHFDRIEVFSSTLEAGVTLLSNPDDKNKTNGLEFEFRLSLLFLYYIGYLGHIVTSQVEVVEEFGV